MLTFGVLVLLAVCGTQAEDALSKRCATEDLSQSHFDTYKAFIGVDEDKADKYCAYGKNMNGVFTNTVDGNEIVATRGQEQYRIQKSGVVDKSQNDTDNNEVVFVDTPTLSSGNGANYMLVGGCRNGEIMNHFMAYKGNVTEADLQELRSAYDGINLTLEDAQSCLASLNSA